MHEQTFTWCTYIYKVYMLHWAIKKRTSNMVITTNHVREIKIQLVQIYNKLRIVISDHVHQLGLFSSIVTMLHVYVCD